MRIRKKEKIIGIGILITLLIIIGGFYYYINRPKPLTNEEIEDMFVEESIQDKQAKDKEVKSEDKIAQSESIVVEIKGEVRNPEVYTLKKGAIVKNLIEEAGGLTEKGDTSAINLAKELQNHECIVIGNIDNKNIQAQSVSVSGTGVSSNSQTDGKVNLNSATEAELDTLPGVGKVMAGKIIEYREKNGGFKDIEELKNIDRVGEATFEKLKDKVSI